jgi:type VI secretion system protein ImpA
MLGDIVKVIGKYAPAEVADEESDADVPADQGGAAEAGVAGVVGAIGAVRGASREDMLRDLGRIADWFRKTEPHSPLAFTLDDAVRRGRMTWPDLLAELVDDTGSRHAILSKLGIRPPTEEGGSY